MVVGAMAAYDNRYDGHILKDSLDQVQPIVGCPEDALENMGYRGKTAGPWIFSSGERSC
jgi:hypothetical protein